MATHAAINFDGVFSALTGNSPFLWQQMLYKEWFAKGRFPVSCNLPTGVGKTSVIPVWLIALVVNPEAVPRRLVYVVNRRTVVDQSTREAESLRERLAAMRELKELKEQLHAMCSAPTDTPLAISTLRGQFADNAEWRSDPARPAIIVGTVDMIGSRLLFSGYGVGFKTKPLHAGFLGQDVLLVHDEAHLEPAFQELLVAIKKEQERCKEFRKFRVLELSATSRGQEKPFQLTDEEENPPDVIPDPPRKPTDIVWRRLKAKKAVHLHENGDDKKLGEQIASLALEQFKDSKRAVLVFLRKIDDVEKAVEKLRKAKQKVQQLTGTLRGLERDKLATEDPIFRRFLPKAEPGDETVYLVCTSAGEVGVNISGDHLVCDLSTFDSMAQRFGRVNRFGDRDDTRIDVVHPAQFDDEDPSGPRRKKTLDLLRALNGDGSPKALGDLDLGDRLVAFAPTPTILSASDILLDSWALTTIRGKLPGRPPVEPYLHGLSEWQPPETHVAWREEVGLLSGTMLEKYTPEDLLEDYPLKPHELLRDRSDRVFKHLAALAKKCPDEPAWLLDDDGAVEPLTLRELTDKDRKDRINYRTALLPPEVGGLLIQDGESRGMLRGSSPYEPENRTCYDVADEWRDERATQRRIRVWDQELPPPPGMRLIRIIDTRPEMDEDEGDQDQPTVHRYWHWFERPASADSDGSKTAKDAVKWNDHTADVAEYARRIVDKLQLPDDVQQAVILAARFHDLGKKRELWQRSIGHQLPKNPTADDWLAKSGKGSKPIEITDYRHEFGSLLDVRNEPEFQGLSQGLQDLVLHLIAAHHGRGRPHFPPGEAFDPDPKRHDVIGAAAEVPQRFARLQRQYGRWGLAYLESLLRAADYAASANPSDLKEAIQGVSQ